LYHRPLVSEVQHDRRTCPIGCRVLGIGREDGRALSGVQSFEQSQHLGGRTGPRYRNDLVVLASGGKLRCGERADEQTECHPEHCVKNGDGHQQPGRTGDVEVEDEQ